MTKTKSINSSDIYEQQLQKADKDRKYVLRLYVTGTTAQSLNAITNLKKICKEYLADCYELEIIDIYQQPLLAEGDQIIAAPTLVKLLPNPLRKLIGDMSNTERVLLGLDLKPKDES